MAHNCQLAHPYSPERVKEWPVVVEPKYDGVRVMVRVDKDWSVNSAVTHTSGPDSLRILYYTRNNKEITSLRNFDQYFWDLALEGRVTVFDGEVCGMKASDFNYVSGQVRQKSGPAQDVWYCLFDYQDLQTPFSSRRIWLYERLMKKHNRNTLAALRPGIQPIFMAPSHYACNDKEVQEMYEALLEEGHEGAMVKVLDAKYEFRRCYNWMKVKPELDMTVRVIRADEGLGKHVGRLGFLSCLTEDGVIVGVGGGFDDAERERIWKQWTDTPSELVGTLLDVGYQNRTDTGSLRFPKFLRWRHDINEKGSPNDGREETARDRFGSIGEDSSPEV